MARNNIRRVVTVKRLPYSGMTSSYSSSDGGGGSCGSCGRVTANRLPARRTKAGQRGHVGKCR